MLGQAVIRKECIDEDAANLAAASHARLTFTRLTLTDFRSYRSATIRFDGRPAAIAGPNGAGKTNLLEALSLLSPGRGLRRARLDELPRQGGAGGWAVAARLSDGDDELRLGVGADAARPDRRVCRIDDRSASGPGAFAEHIRFMWLTPAQDRLFMDGAGERRRFLDRLVLAHDPAHAKISAAYEQAMRQRQRLLDERSRDEEWLSVLERQMAESAVAMASARCAMVTRLAASAVAEDAFPASDLALEGAIEGAFASAKPADIEDDFTALLAERRRADAEAGRATMGPHRSDLIVEHREKGHAARLCSTGEQKALLIGIVLAAAKASQQAAAGDAPLILLLDEIAAHLDPDRRAALFDIIDRLGFQAFMTGTDHNLFDAWGSRAQRFEARDGALTEAS